MAATARAQGAQIVADVREQVRQRLIQFAKQEHAKVMQAEPRPTTFRRAVDGIEGRREEDAKPGSVIAYNYPRTAMVAEAAMELLRRLSPVASGDYQRAHTYFLDGSPVADLSGWKPGLEVLVGNVVPYSRKIELGTMTMRVPGSDRTYARAQSILRRRFGNIADVSFEYRGFSGAAVIGGRAGNKSAARYPVLRIESKGAVLGRLRGR